MRSIILSTIFLGLNIGVLIGAVAYTRHEIQQAKFDAQSEAMIRVLGDGFKTDYVIPVGRYQGEFATGICLGTDGEELALDYAI